MASAAVGGLFSVAQNRFNEGLREIVGEDNYDPHRNIEYDEEHDEHESDSF